MTWSAPSYDYRHVVTLEETNLVGNVYFSHYLRWQGHCRERFLIERAPSVLRALTEDLALVTVSCHCDYFSELYATDTVELRMTLDTIEDNRVAMAFDYYRINDQPSELVARGNQTIACVRRVQQGTAAVPVPTELCRALEPYLR